MDFKQIKQFKINDCGYEYLIEIEANINLMVTATINGRHILTRTFQDQDAWFLGQEYFFKSVRKEFTERGIPMNDFHSWDDVLKSLNGQKIHKRVDRIMRQADPDKVQADLMNLANFAEVEGDKYINLNLLCENIKIKK